MIQKISAKATMFSRRGIPSVARDREWETWCRACSWSVGREWERTFDFRANAPSSYKSRRPLRLRCTARPSDSCVVFLALLSTKVASADQDSFYTLKTKFKTLKLANALLHSETNLILLFYLKAPKHKLLEIYVSIFWFDLSVKQISYHIWGRK